MCYPLRPLRWHLRFLSLAGGLPMVPEDHGLTSFRHTRAGWARVVAFIAAWQVVTW